MKKNIFLSISLSLFTGSWVFAGPRPLYFERACENGVQINLGAVGDFLMHDPLQKKSQNTKSFQPLWKQWLNYTRGVEQMYGNLEVPTARGHAVDGSIVPDPGNVFDRYVHTTFPLFNTHPQILKDINESGFDIVSTANNHALDRGPKGVEATIDELESVGLSFTGTRRRNEVREASVYIESKGIKVGWLACTTVLNSADKEKQVLHCRRDWNKIKEIISRMKHQADAVIVTPHWGEENKNEPHKEQYYFGRQMLDAGATAVLGAHPHVLQPMEKYRTKDGREGFIIYSLANFISFQPDFKQKSSMMLFLGLTKNRSGETFINGVKYIPALMRNRTGNLMDIELLPLEKAQKDPLYDVVKEHIFDLFPVENSMGFGEKIITNSQCR